jgi:hypothetical protein
MLGLRDTRTDSSNCLSDFGSHPCCQDWGTSRMDDDAVGWHIDWCSSVDCQLASFREVQRLWLRMGAAWNFLNPWHLDCVCASRQNKTINGKLKSFRPAPFAGAPACSRLKTGCQRWCPQPHRQHQPAQSRSQTGAPAARRLLDCGGKRSATPLSLCFGEAGQLCRRSPKNSTPRTPLDL